MVPEGWSSHLVSDFGEVQAGRQRSPKFTKGDLRPYLRVANVFDGYIDTSDVLKMHFSDAEYQRYRLRSKDILLNEGQSLELVGRPSMYRGDPQDCCFQNTLVRFRPNKKVRALFALYRFQQCLYDGTFQKIAKKTTSIAHLGVSRFANLKLSWPPLLEQQKIARILSTWDKAIATVEKLIKSSKAQKKALMQQLLTGKRRLPGLGNAHWKEYRLGQLFTERTEGNRPELSLLSITREQGVIKREDVGRKDTSAKDKSNYLRLCPGDIGYNTMRMWQGVSALSSIEGIISPAYTVVTPREDVDGAFMAYLFKLPRTIYNFSRHSQGLTSDTWNLKFCHFREIAVVVPRFDEQQKIASVLAAADREIETWQKKLGHLQQEKKALMQQLLTGKRRVKVDDS